MAQLKLLFEELGFSEVTTYIQSGNVVFSSTKSLSVENIISDGIAVRFGFEVPVFVKTISEVQEILFDCPFSEDKKKDSYFTI